MAAMSYSLRLARRSPCFSTSRGGTERTACTERTLVVNCDIGNALVLRSGLCFVLTQLMKAGVSFPLCEKHKNVVAQGCWAALTAADTGRWSDQEFRRDIQGHCHGHGHGPGRSARPAGRSARPAGRGPCTATVLRCGIATLGLTESVGLVRHRGTGSD